MNHDEHDHASSDGFDDQTRPAVPTPARTVAGRSADTPAVDQWGRLEESVECAQCGYNLIGLAVEGDCPSCNTPIRHTTMRDHGLDEQGAVAIDVECLSCGYNLRGLSRDGKCPECGAGVSQAMRGNQLRFADPVWVKRLHKGLAVIIGTFVASFCAGVVFGVGAVGMAAAAGGPMAGPSAIPQAAELFGALFGIAITASYVWGLKLVTTPEPSKDTVLKFNTVPGALFYCACAFIASAIVGGIAIVSHVTLLQTIRAIVDAPLQAAVMILLLIHLRRLARRIPHKKLVGHATALLWVGTPFLGISFMVPIAALVLTTRTAAPAAGGPTAAAPIPGGVTTGYVTTNGVTSPATTPATGATASGPSAGLAANGYMGPGGGGGRFAAPPVGPTAPPTGLLAIIGTLMCTAVIAILWYLIYIDRFRVVMKKVAAEAQANWDRPHGGMAVARPLTGPTQLE